MPLCIGLTGGIGSGKSSAARIFAELGASIIDTDSIAHEITGPGGGAIAAIREVFGDRYLADDGSLDRKRMRDQVFSSPAARKKLESILHPLIRERARDRVARSGPPYAVLVVPLLLETGAYADLTDRVLVIDCDEALQVARAAARNGMNEETVRAIMATQLPRQQRLEAADDVIRNDGGLDALRKQVEAAHSRYLLLAQHAAGRTGSKHRKSIKKAQ